MIKLTSRAGMLYARYKQKDGVWKKKSLELQDTGQNREYAISVLIPQMRQELSGKGRSLPKSLEHYIKIVLDETLDKKPATAKTYEAAVKTIFAFFGKGKNIADIDVMDVDDFIAEMKKSKLKASTIQVYLAPLSLAFKEAKRVRAISQNPVEDAKIPTIKATEKIPFTVDEMETMIQSATGKLKTYLYIAFYTGARAGEIISLRWSDFDGEQIKITRTKMLGDYNLPKSGKKRTVPVMRPLKEFLETLEQTDELIVGYKEVWQVNRAMKLLQVRIGLAQNTKVAKTTHHIRHTMTSMMFAARENPMLIRDMLGHVDFEMINKTYGHYLKNETDFAGFCKMLTNKAV